MATASKSLWQTFALPVRRLVPTSSRLTSRVIRPWHALLPTAQKSMHSCALIRLDSRVRRLRRKSCCHNRAWMARLRTWHNVEYRDYWPRMVGQDSGEGRSEERRVGKGCRCRETQV